jgi:hypothetical protein
VPTSCSTRNDAATEAEWNSCTDPHKMLAFLRRSRLASERKERLFAVACVRRICHLLPAEGRDAVEVAERFADGAAGGEELQAAYTAASAGLIGVFRDSARAAIAAGPSVAASPLYIGGPMEHTVAAVRHEAFRQALEGGRRHLPPGLEKAERAAQVALVRDLFGPLRFRPVTIDAAWLAWDDGTVRRLAEDIYARRAFETLPVLADALEEAGCTDAQLLDHLRRPGGLAADGRGGGPGGLARAARAPHPELSTPTAGGGGNAVGQEGAMTPEEWERCTDPEKMLEVLRASGRASDRTLRLFGCACGRRIPYLDWHEVWKNAYGLAERYADGLVSKKRLRDCRKAIGKEVALRSGEQELHHLQTVGFWLLDPAPRHAEIALVIPHLRNVPIPQAALLRDIFGNPFRPPALLGPAVLAYNGGDARRLAESIYTSRRFEDLPVLADLLEEAGLTDAELLGHLRGPGPHVLGCHALDAAAGKV